MLLPPPAHKHGKNTMKWVWLSIAITECLFTGLFLEIMSLCYCNLWGFSKVRLSFTIIYGLWVFYAT